MKEMEYGTAPVDHNQQVICMISTASVPATALLVILAEISITLHSCLIFRTDDSTEPPNSVH